MSSNGSLLQISQAERMLAEATTLDGIKQVADFAERMRQFAKAAELGLDAQNHAAKLRIEAQRKGGQMIQAGQERGEIASQNSGNRKVLHDDTPKTLADVGISRQESSRWQHIASIPEDTYDKHITETIDDGDELTSAGVLRLAKKLEGGRDLGPLMTSQTNEWYTTPDIINLAIEVMGGIDLDPCSNSKESPNVPAQHHLTKEDNGLGYPWFGRVYMNPPYGTAIAEWVDKLATEYEEGRVEQAIALTPARPDTRWFRRLRDYPRCFMFGRVKFNDHENSAPFPTMLVGLGCDRQQFINVLSEMGDIYERVEL